MHCLCVNNRIPIYTLKNYWSIQTAGALVNLYMPPVMLARSGELVVCLLILQISTVDLSTSKCHNYGSNAHATPSAVTDSIHL